MRLRVLLYAAVIAVMVGLAYATPFGAISVGGSIVILLLGLLILVVLLREWRGPQ